MAAPNVTIEELKRDRVKFVLENVDLAYVVTNVWHLKTLLILTSFANSLRRVMMADLPTVGECLAVGKINNADPVCSN